MSAEPQVHAAHYDTWAYNTKERLCSFWHQLDEVRRIEARAVLEVGPGGGTVTGWLRARGVAVTTVDIDAALAPDVVASVLDLPLADGAVDVALCCEVLEHLPFADVPRALSELRRVARLAVVVSVPDERPWVGKAYPLYFGMYVDGLRREHPTRRSALGAVLRRRMRFRDAVFLAAVPERWSRGGPVAEPRPPVPHRPASYAFDGEHHWELGTVQTPVERLTAAFSAVGLTLERDFRVPENPWHHFFVLRPA